MLLQTKYFGQVDCPEEHVLHFPGGLFGFEEEKRFALLPFEGSGGSLLCFQSAATPQLAFVAMDPFSLRHDYHPALPAEELRELGAEKIEELCFYTLCVMRQPVAESTVNLRCPVVINPRTRRALQVILESGVYEMHHRLSEFGNKGGEGPC